MTAREAIRGYLDTWELEYNETHASIIRPNLFRIVFHPDGEVKTVINYADAVKGLPDASVALVWSRDQWHQV